MDRLTYWKQRARDAEWRLKIETAQNACTERWAQEAFKEQRYLRDRLTLVYGIAVEHGVTREQLAGPVTP